MRKKILILPFVTFSLVLLTFFYLLIIDRNPSEIPSTLLNKNYPKFETESLLKKEKFLSVKEFKNKTVLVNFFASWCKSCSTEHKFIQRFSDDETIKVIGINYKDNPKKALAWLKKLGNPYSNIAIDKNGRIAIDWGVYGIPETFVVSREGIIQYRHVGPVNNKIFKKINSIIKKNDR